MSASVDLLQQRTLDDSEKLCDLFTSSITLATMLRQRKMAAWMRQEFDGYTDPAAVPPFRREVSGHIVVKSPQYGWVQAPVNEEQTEQFGLVDLPDSVRYLENACLSSKKGSSHRVKLAPEVMKDLQQQVHLMADLAISVNRSEYCKILQTLRGALYLWCNALLEAGLAGEFNHYSSEQKEQVADLDTPQPFWRAAMEQRKSLPVPDVREASLFDRMFGRTG
jgi:hypothetical protein